VSEVIVSQMRLGRVGIALTVDATLTADQQATHILEFSGTGAFTVTLNSAIDGQVWTIYNACTGNLTIKASGATGITIATTKVAQAYCDGTDVRRITADSART
jgi:hypothetical protein